MTLPDHMLTRRRSLEQMIRYAARHDDSDELALMLADAYQTDPADVYAAIQAARVAAIEARNQQETSR